jgi:hypothetical protein
VQGGVPKEARRAPARAENSAGTGTAKPKRASGLRQVSARRAAENRRRRQMAAEVFGDDQPCWIRWDKDCGGLATDLHEPRKRSHGADICDPAECVPACRHCHSAAHAHPAEAEKRGWLIRSGSPSGEVA